jgi:hypothetical protein
LAGRTLDRNVTRWTATALLLLSVFLNWIVLKFDIGGVRLYRESHIAETWLPIVVVAVGLVTTVSAAFSPRRTGERLLIAVTITVPTVLIIIAELVGGIASVAKVFDVRAGGGAWCCLGSGVLTLGARRLGDPIGGLLTPALRSGGEWSRRAAGGRAACILIMGLLAGWLTWWRYQDILMLGPAKVTVAGLPAIGPITLVGVSLAWASTACTLLRRSTAAAVSATFSSLCIALALTLLRTLRGAFESADSALLEEVRRRLVDYLANSPLAVGPVGNELRDRVDTARAMIHRGELSVLSLSLALLLLALASGILAPSLTFRAEVVAEEPSETKHAEEPGPHRK